MNEMDNMQNNTEETCGIEAFERNKYFYGKLMTVRDFETEQRYFNAKRSMLNRLIHGIGLVCGLEVSEPEIVDQKLKLSLSTGVALDCCGREIVIEDAGVYDVDGSPVEGLNYVYLRYLECLKEPVPSLSNPSACEEVCCYSRIKESFKLELGQAPTSALPFNWKEIWEERKQDIQDLASRLGIADPLGSLAARLIISADEYLKVVGCPSCDDPKALLAVVRVTGSNAEVDEDETLALRGVVYNNPMLYELLKSHLTDVDNPHQVTAEQTKALMSINNVGNAPAEDEWVQNVDINSPDDTITVEPNAAANRIDIKTTHAQINPLSVNPAQTDTTRDKHVANADANRWNKSLVSINDVANPGGNIDLIEGEGIKIEPDPRAHEIRISSSGGIASIDGVGKQGGNVDLVEGEGIKIEPDAANSTIKISAAGIAGANTGTVQVTIPKAKAGEVIVAVVPPVPGHEVVQNIPHGLETDVAPAIILGLVSKVGIIMEEDFITQRELIELMANIYNVPAPPPVSFRALAVTNSKFDILAVNMDLELEATIIIRWWAVPAIQTVGGKDIGKIAGAVRERVGIEAISAVAAEKNVAESEASVVIGDVMKTVSEEPSGVTVAAISRATGTTTGAIQPIIEAMVEEGVFVVEGSGARRRFTIRR